MSRIAAPSVRVTSQSCSRVVCPHAEVAGTFLSRLIGLLGRTHLPPDTGLWLTRSSGVHTFAMRFPIDVVALDKDLRVVALHRRLRPWRVALTGKGVQSILELPSGQIDNVALTVGEHLQIASLPG